MLCVTPASAACSELLAPAGRSGRQRRREGGRRGVAVTGLSTDTVRRTRAGAASAVSTLSGFLHCSENGDIWGGGSRRAGAGVRRARGLEFMSGDKWGGGGKRSRVWRMFDRMRGVAPSASAAETKLLDDQVWMWFAVTREGG